MDDQMAGQLRALAESALEELNPLSENELGFNSETVEWLDGYIDRIRESGQFSDPVERQRLATTLGCVLGECIINAYGGQWNQRDGEWGVAIDGQRMAFPISKALNRLGTGEEPVSAFFRSLEKPA